MTFAPQLSISEDASWLSVAVPHWLQVVIVDEFTGRTMPGRRWGDGLHQAIEAKERLPIQNETVTLASISYQVWTRCVAVTPASTPYSILNAHMTTACSLECRAKRQRSAGAGLQ